MLLQELARLGVFLSTFWRLHSLVQLCNSIVYQCANFQYEILRMKETSSCASFYFEVSDPILYCSWESSDSP
jgi:hypothetical protein